MNTLFIEQDRRESEAAVAKKKKGAESTPQPAATSNPLFNAAVAEGGPAPSDAFDVLQLDGADGLADESTDGPSPEAVSAHRIVRLLRVF